MAISLFGLENVPLWLILLLIGVFVVAVTALIWLQCLRAIRRNRFSETVDWSAEAETALEEARKHIEEGLVNLLRSEFGDTVPSDEKRLLKYISDSFAERAGGQYIPVEVFSSFLHGSPYVQLRGSDVIGGVSVLPVRISERGEKFFYLEGLSIRYRRDEYQRVARYHIRFLPEKAGLPIEDVLDFEEFKTTV